MTVSVGLPEGFELNGVVTTGPGRRVGDALVYPATVGEDVVELREYWPADLSYRTAQRGAVAAQQALEQPLAQGRARFVDLTRALQAFEHPFVPPSTGFEANGGAYRVTQTGRKTLGQLLTPGETLCGNAILRLAAGIADALEAVHAAGFLHLDIQPHTVAPSEGGVELTGFSTDRRPLMKPAGRQDGLVTPGYSPIELHDGMVEDQLGPFTDIYSASALLRRLIIGRAFIDKEQDLRLEDQPLDWPPNDVPPSVIKAIEAGLKVHPEDRPQSVEAWRKGWPPRGALDEQWKALALRSGLPSSPGPSAEAAAAAASAAALATAAMMAAAAAAAPKPAPTPEPAPAPRPEPASAPKPDPVIIPPGPSSLADAKPAAAAGPVLTPAPKKKSNDFLRVLLVIGVVLAAVVAGMRYLGKPVAEMVEPSATYYVTRGVRVRPAPSTANRPLTELRRGEAVRGHPVEGAEAGTRWLKVTEGPHKGQYVWLRNLSTTPRPAINDMAVASLQALESGPVRAEPREGAPGIGDLKVGDGAQVQGTTSDGWSELALRQGGVGYVRSSTLGPIPDPGHDADASEEDGPISPEAEEVIEFFKQFQDDADQSGDDRGRQDDQRGARGRGKGRGPPG